MDFERWFADYLQQDVNQIEKLLTDRTAVSFLIAWSILESKCFKGFANIQELKEISTQISKTKNDNEELIDLAKYFHTRYQDKQLYKNLTYNSKPSVVELILGKAFSDLNSYDRIFLLLFVVYRFRNNIFHGNKGVESWLAFREQISYCVCVIQIIVTKHSKLTTSISIAETHG